MAKILVVEDDRKVATAIVDWLRFEKYAVEFRESGQEALELMRSYFFDLIILDIALPQMSGLEVCRQFRAAGGTSRILMLTGKDTIAEKETGLDAGADDYLTKPFHFKELSARIRALMRRPVAMNDDTLRAGNIALNTVSHVVTRNDEILHLAPIEFAFLEHLMRYPDQVFSNEILLERVWTSDSPKSSEGIRTTVKKLRDKIDEEGKPSIIQNVRGIGYKLADHVRGQADGE
jgi:DNA-binding response OmpR family regulator